MPGRAKIVSMGVVVLGVVILIVLTRGTPTPSGSPSLEGESDEPGDAGRVARVIDAATIELESGQRVRYLGVNIPTVKERVECFGKEALAANEVMLGKEVRLEKDEKADKAKDGAYLRYVFFTTPSGSPSLEGEGSDEPEEIFVNERIIEGGFGFPLLQSGMVHRDRLAAAARFASATGKGLWSQCEVNEAQPGLFKTQEIDECIIKGKVLLTGERVYRTPNCLAYKETVPIQSEGDAWFCAEDTAQSEGWVQAEDC